MLKTKENQNLACFSRSRSDSSPERSDADADANSDGHQQLLTYAVNPSLQAGFLAIEHLEESSSPIWQHCTAQGDMKGLLPAVCGRTFSPHVPAGTISVSCGCMPPFAPGNAGKQRKISA
jgi:hypothetical protein